MATDLHALGLDRFDFNAFALRVVSTDRSADCYDPTNLDKTDHTLMNHTPATPSSLLDQSKTQAGDQQADTGNSNTQSTFSIPDDTQVYFTDSDLKLYSFTHHLTLFDINARGYVHPVALSYISRDTEKIVSRFEEFMNRFNEVSRLMKKGNYTNFMLDLKCRLLDLEHTERILSTDNNSPTTTSKSTQLSSFSEISNSIPTNSSLTVESQKILTQSSAPSEIKRSSATTTISGSTARASTQLDKTTTIDAASPTDDKPTKYDDIDQQKNSSFSPSITPSKSNNQEKVPKIITTPSVTQPKEPVTTVEDSTKQREQQPASAPVGHKECLSMEALHQAQTVTRLMLDAMDTYATQWIRTPHDGDNSEDLSTDLEDDSPISPTYVDKNQVVDSPEVFEPAKDYQPKYVDTLYPVAHFDRKLRTLSQLCHEPDRDQILRHRHSSNNGHQPRSLPSTSVIPLVSIIEPQRRKTNKAIKRRLFDKITNHDMYTEAIKYITDFTTELGRSSVALELEEEDTQFIEPLSHAMTFGRVFMLNLEDSHLRHETTSLSDLSNQGSKMNTDPILANDQPSPASTSKRISEDGVNDDTEDEAPEASQESRYYSPLRPTTQLWESKQKQNYGNLLYILRKHNQYIHHVIYSLLTGRSVVVVGNPDGKSRIQEIVYALSIFVPGLSKQQHQIVPWFSGGKLNEELLSSMKLVGTADINVDPSLYRLDITCLEVDHSNGNGRLITSPLYLDGQWIYRLLSKIPFYTTDESYIGYLHAMFMDISLLAYAYYHKYKDDDDDDSYDGYTYSTSGTSLEMRHNEKSGTHSSVSSYNGSPLEEDRRPLGKKWSVRRIVNYLKRIEDGEPDDYFGNVGNVNNPISITNTSPKSTSTTPSAASISFVSATSSPIASSSSSISSSPLSASSLLQQHISASDGNGEGLLVPTTATPHSIPSHILSQFEATTHRNHRHRQHQIQQSSSQHPHPATSKKEPVPSPSSSSSSIRHQQDETSSDHYSEDNDATVTLDNIQNQPHLLVTQLNWNPPSPKSVSGEPSSTAASADKSTATATTTTAAAVPPPIEVFETTSTIAIPASGSRRTSETFSESSVYSMSSASRRNSSSNTSSSFVSTFSYDDSNDSSMDLWRHFDNTLDVNTSDYEDDGGGSVHDRQQRSTQRKQSQQKNRQQQRQNGKPKKRLPDGGVIMSSQSDTRSYSSERRGQTFLEQTFHVIGDDQAIVMYLANIHSGFA
ncbi:unnamed protein product [Absidia cylindrospora]